MPLKFDMFMSLNGQTWSESHYFLPGTTLPVQTSPFLSLMSFRAACLGYGASVTGGRISTVPGSEVTEDIYLPGGGYIPHWPLDPIGGTYNATIPNDSLLVRMSAAVYTASPIKSLYLAAPPAVAISTSSHTPNDVGSDASFSTALGQYMYQLTGNATPGNFNGTSGDRWGYRVRDTSQELYALAPVTNSGYPGMIGIPTLVPIPNVGDLPGNIRAVYITGYRRINPRLQGLSGKWEVFQFTSPVAPATNPYTYYLINSGNVSPTNFLTKGLIAPLVYVYRPYGPLWNVDKAVTRKRGESIGARRGRSRIRA
jgi:hypothetical protein